MSLGYTLAIDLGDKHTVIYKLGAGVVLKEPSLVAVEVKGGNRYLKEFGLRAKEMMGQTTNEIDVVCPLADGTIVNFDLCKMMLQSFINKLRDGGVIKKPKSVVILIPCGLTDEEKNMYYSLAYSVGISKVALLPCAIASIYSMCGTSDMVSAKMVVNIGAEVTDIAILSGLNVLKGCTINIGGNDMDNAIRNYINEKYNVRISETEAERVKLEIGTVLVNDIRRTKVVGVDMSTKDYRELVVYSTDLTKYLEAYYLKISDVIETVLNMASADMIASVYKNGIFVCGGASKLTGVDKLLRDSLGYNVFVDNEPEYSVMYGAGMMLSNAELMKTVVEENDL